MNRTHDLHSHRRTRFYRKPEAPTTPPVTWKDHAFVWGFLGLALVAVGIVVATGYVGYKVCIAP